MSKAFLTAKKIEERYGILSQTLRLWASKPVAPLGRELHAKYLKTRSNPKGEKRRRCKRVYREADVRRILKAESQLDGNAWLTAPEVRDVFGFTILDRWRKRCPTLGRKIDAREVPWLERGASGRVRHRTVWKYSRKDVEDIAAARLKAPREVVKGEWLSAVEAGAIFGFSAWIIRFWGNGPKRKDGTQRKGKCPALGRPLSTRQELRHNGHHVTPVTVYHRGELERIRKAKDEAAHDWIPIGEASETFAIPRPTLHWWADRKRRTICPPLGRRIRAIERKGQMVDRRTRKILHFHRDDLEAIRRVRAGLPPEPEPKVTAAAPTTQPPANAKRGRPRSEAVEKRNGRIIQLAKEHRITSELTKLCDICNADPEIIALNLPKKLTRFNVRDILRGKRAGRETNSRK